MSKPEILDPCPDLQDSCKEVTSAERAHLESGSSSSLPSAVIGVLIGFRDEGRTPLVIFPGQIGHAAVPARATQDIHGAHIGQQVALLFEGADPRRPIIVGRLQRTEGWPLNDPLVQVEVEADGARLLVSAKEQLVLQCGKASITLTKAGKVLIDGTYVSTRSSGAHRIKGGSVQIN